MRTPGLWASMRGIRYMPFARLAKPKAIPPAYAAYLMGLFVRHALRAGRSGSPTLQPAHTRDRGIELV